MDRYDAVELHAPSGERRKTIRRTPADRWFQVIRDVAVGPDGAAAVLAWSGTNGVSLFDAAGEPVRFLPGPPGHEVALGAGWGAVNAGRTVLLFSRAGGPFRRFTPPGSVEGDWITPLTDPAGRELWLHRAGTLRIDRYGLPPAAD